METIYKHIPIRRLHARNTADPYEYFAHCIHMRELGEYTPLNSYERFATMMRHFNKHIRRHLEKQQHRYAGSGITTVIHVVYDSPNGSPTIRQQERYIQQWGEHGVNDLLDGKFGCVISPHMLISQCGDTIMLYVNVEWKRLQKLTTS